MAAPSVTYTFANSTTADATQVNQNFTDLINAMTDGTKDFVISALQCDGNATFNANVTLGNGTPDDITVSGSLASSIPIKTNNSYDIGTSTLGLAGVYLGAPSSRSTRVRAHQSLSGSYTATLPDNNYAAGKVSRTDGSAQLAWAYPAPAPRNYSLTTSVASNALTIALKDAAGSAASALSPIDIPFRSATAATGTVTWRAVTAALSVEVDSGATLGHVDGEDRYVYVYALDNAGTVELAVSGQPLFDNGTRETSTALSNAADSPHVLYSETARTDVAVTFLGRVKSNQTTAGTWASNASEVSSSPFLPPIVSDWYKTTITVGGSTSAPTDGAPSVNEVYWRRVGGDMQIRYHLRQTDNTGAAVGSGTYLFPVPNSETMDTSRITPSTGGIAPVVGPATVFWDGAGYDGSVVAFNSTNLAIVAGNSLNNTAYVASGYLHFNSSNMAYSFFASVPIDGWSATS
jgi:hypothetical protein